MKLPRGLSEAKVLAVIDDVVSKLSPKLAFGFYSLEDIQQEAWIIAATKGLDKFDDTMFEDATPDEMAKALERFLRVHVNNRMKNFKRDNIGRSEKPVNPDKVAAWEKRNALRRNIMRPISIHELATNYDTHNLPLPTVSDSTDGVIEEIHHSHLMDLINKGLPIELRNDFLRMCDGVRLPKPRQAKVREAIGDILKGEKEGDLDGDE